MSREAIARYSDTFPLFVSIYNAKKNIHLAQNPLAAAVHYKNISVDAYNISREMEIRNLLTKRKGFRKQQPQSN
jgi:hypothetical protein